VTSKKSRHRVDDVITADEENTSRDSLVTSHRPRLTIYDAVAILQSTSGYATWFTAGGAIRIAHYDVIDDVITRKL